MKIKKGDILVSERWNPDKIVVVEILGDLIFVKSVKNDFVGCLRSIIIIDINDLSDYKKL